MLLLLSNYYSSSTLKTSAAPAMRLAFLEPRSRIKLYIFPSPYYGGLYKLWLIHSLFTVIYASLCIMRSDKYVLFFWSYLITASIYVSQLIHVCYKTRTHYIFIMCTPIACFSSRLSLEIMHEDLIFNRVQKACIFHLPVSIDSVARGLSMDFQSMCWRDRPAATPVGSLSRIWLL